LLFNIFIIFLTIDIKAKGVLVTCLNKFLYRKWPTPVACSYLRGRFLRIQVWV